MYNSTTKFVMRYCKVKKWIGSEMVKLDKMKTKQHQGNENKGMLINESDKISNIDLY